MGIAWLCIEKSHKIEIKLCFYLEFFGKKLARHKNAFFRPDFLASAASWKPSAIFTSLVSTKVLSENKLHPDSIRQHCKKMIFTLTLWNIYTRPCRSYNITEKTSDYHFFLTRYSSGFMLRLVLSLVVI